MVISVVGELKDVGRKRRFFFRGVAKFCGILVENRIRVGWDVFVGVYGDQSGGINGSIDVVSEKTLSEAGDYEVVRDVWKGGEVGDILELLMIGGRLPVHGHRKSCRLRAG